MNRDLLNIEHRITLLTSERDQLKAELEEAKRVIEKYADGSAWRARGGKLAREFLERKRE